MLALALAVACGAAAPATPAPPAAKAPAPAAPAAAAPSDAKAPAAAPAAKAIPGAKPAPTPAPTAPPRAKVDRLVLSASPLPHETDLFWEGSLSSALAQRPMQEHLIDVDQVTLQLKPMLATKWEMSPDGKTWTFQLRKGVPYHFGFGEFTGADVVHSLERITSLGSLATYAGDWQKLVGKTPEEIRQNVKVVDPYQVVFNLKSPFITLDSWQVAAYTDLLMVSKNQWDKVGIEGMRQKPAGTGSYQYKERRLGEYIRFERVENHWRQAPEFKELEMRFPPEDATRLAALLAGEAHIADLPRSLQKEAAARGMKLIPSKVPIVYAFYIMGGNYSATPEKLDPKIPWANPATGRLVREAMNRAVNQKELRQTIFEGQGDPMYNASYHPTLPGYNPEWEKQFEAKYGYDPEKAKKLIAQAGYPNGFKVTLVSTVLPGLPEMPQLVEAMDLYLRRIGLQVEIKAMEFATLRDLYRKKNVQGLLWPHRGTYRPPEENVNVYNYSKLGGVVFVFEHPLIDQKFDALRKSLDLAERDRLLREIGDIKFEEYDVIPLLWLPVNASVNPKVVREYNFGTITGVWTHLEYIKQPR